VSGGAWPERCRVGERRQSATAPRRVKIGAIKRRGAGHGASAKTARAGGVCVGSPEIESPPEGEPAGRDRRCPRR
jgi:hypothetical protein